MSTIIKYSKAVITSQLFFCIENLQFSLEKVLIIVDTYTTYNIDYILYITYGIVEKKIFMEKLQTQAK